MTAAPARQLEQLSGIKAMLDALGWPVTDRQVFVGWLVRFHAPVYRVGDRYYADRDELLTWWDTFRLARRAPR